MRFVVAKLKKVLAAALCVALLTTHLQVAVVAAALHTALSPVNLTWRPETALSVGTGSFVIHENGDLYAWGTNYEGQLGDGTTTDRLRPVRVMENVVAVSSDPSGTSFSAHTLALTADGTLYGFGSAGFGQLTGFEVRHLTPHKIMDGVVAASAGTLYSLAIRADGTLWAWGANDLGQLGNGGEGQYSGVPIMIMENVAAVSAGYRHAAAVKTDGSLWTWGINEYGQLGDGTTTNRTLPVKVMDNVKAVSVGDQHTMALRNDGTVWTWGANTWSQLGNGHLFDFQQFGEENATQPHPNPIKVFDNAVAISAGFHHSAALRADGSLWTWGNNDQGQVGDGRISYKTTPYPTRVMDNVQAVYAGGNNTMVIRDDNSAWIWGVNDYGQLGDGTTTNPHWGFNLVAGNPASTPQPVNPLDAARMLTHGYSITQVQEIFERELFLATNIAREYYGVAPVIWDESLTLAARAHSNDMMNNHFIEHDGSDGSTPNERAAREGWFAPVFENVCRGPGGCGTAMLFVENWLMSPGHRENLLNPSHTHMGASLSLDYFIDEWGRVWWSSAATQKFGSQR